MNRIEQLRAGREHSKRSRWWRDGISCAFVGAFSGLIASVVYGSLILAPICAVVGGILGAVFGDRVLPFLQWC